jgi:ABC-2 type transport system permease protein
MEHRLQPYFWAALRYNVFWQCLRTGLLFAAMLPLYETHLGARWTFWISLLILLCYQALHTVYAWYRLRYRSFWLTISFYIVHFVFFSLLLAQQWIWLPLIALAIFGSYVFLQKRQPLHPWPWLVMIVAERRRVAFYQKFASWFIDLPRREQTIKPRRYLVRLLQIFERRTHPLTFLYWRRFLRDSDYLSPYLWGLLAAGSVMWLFPQPAVLIVGLLVGQLLFILQFRDLANSEQYPIWLQLYPRQEQGGLPPIALTLLALQGTILALNAWIISASPVQALLVWGISWLGNVGYSLFYLPYRQRVAQV